MEDDLAPNGGFASWLILNGRRRTTVKKHLNCLKYLAKNGVVVKEKLTKEEIDKFLFKLKDEGKSGAYLNMFVNAIRVYAQYRNLGIELLKYKQFKKLPGLKATFSDEEIEAFLSLPPEKVRRRHHITGKEYWCPANPKNYYKWTVFFSICAFTAMRPGEVAHLKVSDCDFGRSVFVIRTSKTNTPGIAPIPPNIKEVIQEWIKNKDTNDYLFPSDKGGNHYSAGGEAVLDNVDWHYNFHKRIDRLGIKRPRLTVYSFRHSMATRLLEENVSLFHVQKILRHTDLKSTLVYSHLTTKDVIEAIQKHPIIRRGSNPKFILHSLADVIKSFHIENDERFNYRIEENDHSLRFEVYLKCLFLAFFMGDIWVTFIKHYDDLSDLLDFVQDMIT